MHHPGAASRGAEPAGCAHGTRRPSGGCWNAMLGECSAFDVDLSRRADLTERQTGRASVARWLCRFPSGRQCRASQHSRELAGLG
jgi:hypothetical protein